IVSAYFIFKTLEQQKKDSLRETQKTIAGFDHGIKYALEDLEFNSQFRLIISNTGDNIKNVRVSIQKLEQGIGEYSVKVNGNVKHVDINKGDRKAFSFCMAGTSLYELKIEFQDAFLNDYQQKILVAKCSVIYEYPYRYVT